MYRLIIILFLALPLSIFSQKLIQNQDEEIIKYYQNHKNQNKASKSTGTVSNGKIENSHLVPFYGSNFTYFDKESYLSARAFTNDKVKTIILNSYKYFEVLHPKKHFYLMELSNKNGGKLLPHRTHQNGLSVDFMMPKLKKGVPYSGLDSLGKNHYWLSFNNKGEYSEDKTITIDFKLIAEQILNLEKNARKNGMKIQKVIIKTEYKELLYATEFGKELKKSNIYLVKQLSRLINSLHDEHFHVDFVKI